MKDRIHRGEPISTNPLCRGVRNGVTVTANVLPQNETFNLLLNEIIGLIVFDLI
jgi:hypothetical protein